MAVRTKARAMSDPRYIEKGMSGEAREGRVRVGTGAPQYFALPAERGSEPSGIWVGEGLADLGIHDGDLVKTDQFAKIYGHFLDTRDPEGKATLGAPPRKYDAYELRLRYEAKLEQHPGATEEEKAALWREARAETPGQGAMFFDTTFDVDKTITLAHASAMAAAAEARRQGNEREAREWDAKAASIWEEIITSARMFVAEVQKEVSWSRVGHHGGKVDGHPSGEIVRSAEVPVAMFPQHTNRDGEPHLHIHVLWLNKAMTLRDGQWRAIFSKGLFGKERAGATALAAYALESGLTARHGFVWKFREKTHGRVIHGVRDQEIDAFSSRTVAVTHALARLAEEYEKRHGYPPDRYALQKLHRTAHDATRKAKSADAVDYAQLLRQWEGKAQREQIGALHDMAHRIWHPSERVRVQTGMTQRQEDAVMAAGLEEVQASWAHWERGELAYSIGQFIPDGAVAPSQEAGWAALEALRDRALAGGAGERVYRVDAPQWPPCPRELQREDGAPVWAWPRPERYATETQLDTEARLLVNARRRGAAHLAPDVCAKRLGVSLDMLEAQIAGADTQDTHAQAGLRVDQATAAFVAQTSTRTVEIIVGPAGTGKSYIAGQMARAWQGSGLGKVIGIAPTSAARNVLKDEGIKETWNCAQFLGHLKEGRGLLGHKPVGQAPLGILDEGTIAASSDVADIVGIFADAGGKVVIFIDPAQLGAPGAGGSVEMLMRKLGYCQLNTVVRFAEDWEGDASLAIREGDRAALQAYDLHGRLHAGSYEEMAERSVRMYLEQYLQGQDVVMNAQSLAEVHDLNRRTQGYLLEWDKIGGPGTALRDDARAYLGDVIVARENRSEVQAGEADRKLINSDLLRVENIGGDDITVRRWLAPGRWTEPFAITRDYAGEHCGLGYARTTITVEGKTTDYNINFGHDRRARNAVYPGITRGRLANHGLIYGECEMDPVGPVPGQELARGRARQAQRDGAIRGLEPDSADPLPMFARVLSRDDGQLAATEFRERSLSDADHFAKLRTIWDHVSRKESGARFRAAVRHLLPDDADEVLEDTDDLWRSLRTAELAGLDGPQVLGEALQGADFRGARSKSAVLNGRVRKVIGDRPPLVHESWHELVPDGQRGGYMSDLAQYMDERQEREGEHAAEHSLPWATQALGPVPDDQAEHEAWAKAAGKIAAYRGITGHEDPGKALGPEPGTTSPEYRMLWHNAQAVATRTDGVDVRDLTDGKLMTRVRAAGNESARAPKRAAEELRLARRALIHSGPEIMRHINDGLAARRLGNEELAQKHLAAADRHREVADRARFLHRVLGQAQDTREEWERSFAPTRRIAVAGQAELARRGIDVPLMSKEPEGIRYPWHEREEAAPVDPAEREKAMAEVLGLRFGDDHKDGLPFAVRDVVDYNRERQAEMDERNSLQVPDEDPDYLDLGQAWPQIAEREGGRILQKPPPEITPSWRVAELAAERDAQAGL